MYEEKHFTIYSRVLSELSAEHAGAAPWRDRTDLPAGVRGFWGALGVSALTRDSAPRATREEDERRLADVFERWFEDAATRDRWQVEAEDEPVPWRRLPERPRLVDEVAEQGLERVLIASDVAPDPTLHVFTRRSPNGVSLPCSYLRWSMFFYLRSGTKKNATDVFWGPDLKPEPLWQDEESPADKVADGVYLLNELPEPAPFGITVMYRDLATYTKYVLSRSEDERKYFASPKGAVIEFRPSKSMKLDPGGSRYESGFTLMPNKDRTERKYLCLSGEIEGHWVWTRRLEPSRIAMICEGSASEALQQWLVTQGAKVLETGWYVRASDVGW